MSSKLILNFFFFEKTSCFLGKKKLYEQVRIMFVFISRDEFSLRYFRSW